MTRGTEHPDAGSLTAGEVQQAIELSGYPLEVELLAELTAANVPASLGQRHEVAKDQYKEIDLTALIRMRPVAKRDDGKAINVFHRLLVQVKRPTGNAQLVGVLGRQVPNARSRNERLVLAGSITNEDLAEESAAEVFQSLSEALQPFDEVPICAHWAVVKRRRLQDGKTYEPWASGDDAFYEDLSTLVRAREFEVIRATTQRREVSSKASVKLRAITIALIVDQPQIFVYDPIKKELRAVPQMTVVQDFDTAYGPVRACVDCVARGEFPTYIARCKDTAAQLANIAREQAEAIFDVTEELRLAAEVDLLSEQVGAIPD